MIQIGDKVIGFEMFARKFVCDIARCKGICCYEGDSGAPLEDDEVKLLDEIYPQIEPYLTEQERAEVAKQGKWVVDDDGDKVTPIIGGCECVYTMCEPDGTWKCAIEQAYNDGKINFRKPISCHLYPIRVTHYRTFDAINFHEWDACCKPALELGEKLGVPVYKFLKEPIVRAWGEEFYNEMEIAAAEIEKAQKRKK